jgi:hypothetical protein
VKSLAWYEQQFGRLAAGMTTRMKRRVTIWKRQQSDTDRKAHERGHDILLVLLLPIVLNFVRFLLYDDAVLLRRNYILRMLGNLKFSEALS